MTKSCFPETNSPARVAVSRSEPWVDALRDVSRAALNGRGHSGAEPWLVAMPFGTASVAAEWTVDGRASSEAAEGTEDGRASSEECVRPRKP